MNGQEEKMNKHPGTFLRLLKYAVPYIGHLALGLILMLGVIALDLYRPILIGSAVDIFAENGDTSLLAGISVRYLICIIAIFLLNAASALIIGYTGQSIIYNLRMEVFKHVQSLSLRFFDITPVGKIVTRVTNDVESLNEMFTNVIINLIKND